MPDNSLVLGRDGDNASTKAFPVLLFENAAGGLIICGIEIIHHAHLLSTLEESWNPRLFQTIISIANLEIVMINLKTIDSVYSNSEKKRLLHLQLSEKDNLTGHILDFFPQAQNMTAYQMLWWESGKKNDSL